MSVRSAIPAVEGVQDRQVAIILGAMKAIIEKATGRTPNSPQIKTLGANATIGSLITKVNEIINRLQDATATGIATSATEAQDASVAKAWVLFNGSTGAITASYNVDTVTKNATGDYTINFKIPFSGPRFAMVGTAGQVAGGTTPNGVVGHNEDAVVFSASAVRIYTLASTTAATTDYPKVSVVFFGSQ